MPYPWNTLLTNLTDPELSFNVPFSRGINATSEAKSYLGPLVNGTILRSANMAYASYSYPITGAVPQESDNEIILNSVLAGFQIQIIEGAFSEEDTNPSFLDDIVVNVSGLPFQFRANGRPFGDTAPGDVIFDSFVQVAKDESELASEPFIPNSNVLQTQSDLPNNLFEKGKQYTLRVRAILVAVGDITNFGTLWYQYEGGRPFYTGWSSSIFRVNGSPTITNQSINGESLPLELPSSDDINFQFTFLDEDGPSFGYELQVGTYSTPTFAPDIWTSGVVVTGNGTGSKDFSVLYGGPALITGVLYYWRVRGHDGIVNGDWTNPKSFKKNTPPVLQSIRINSRELILGEEVLTTTDSPVLSWVYFDADAHPQASYSVTISYEGGTTKTFEGTGNITQVTLPKLPSDKEVSVDITVSDGIDDSIEYSVVFTTNAPPKVADIGINGLKNPVGLAPGNPTISWMYQDSMEAQVAYRIKVSRNINFTDLVWDTGIIGSSLSSVVYGSTPSPVTPAETLVHEDGIYYVRIQVYDGTTWSKEEDSGAFAFMAINNKPGMPTLLYPTTGAYSGSINVRWTPATVIDADGDVVTYTLELTSKRLSNRDWSYLAGPFPSTQESFPLDLSKIPSGDNYGIRIIASDAVSESTPSASDRFTILNHAPVTPSIVRPMGGDKVSTRLKVEWVEGNPVDVDGDYVIYIVEISTNASNTEPLWHKLGTGTFPEGTIGAVFDVSEFDSSTDCQVRIKAIDQKGTSGVLNYSGIFSLTNETLAMDFERVNGTLYISTSDGKIMEAQESIWQYYQDWNGLEDAPPLEVFLTNGAKYEIRNGKLTIFPNKGTTCVFRDGE